MKDERQRIGIYENNVNKSRMHNIPFLARTKRQIVIVNLALNNIYEKNWKKNVNSSSSSRSKSDDLI